MEALKAEGVPCGVGAHGRPIYQEGPFVDTTLFDQLGCARAGSLYDREIDYRVVCCPNAEKVYKDEVCSFPHAMFLGELDEIDLILAALRKIRENRDELK